MRKSAARSNPLRLYIREGRCTVRGRVIPFVADTVSYAPFL